VKDDEEGLTTVLVVGMLFSPFYNNCWSITTMFRLALTYVHSGIFTSEPTHGWFQTKEGSSCYHSYYIYVGFQVTSPIPVTQLKTSQFYPFIK
jgi:hypothetical protein